MTKQPNSFSQSEPVTTDELNQQIRDLIRHQSLDQAAEICFSAVQHGHVNKEIYIFYVLLLIRQKEIEKQESQTFDLSTDPDVLIDHYHTLKFLIRRQEFPQMEPLQKELYSYCREFNVSHISLAIITQFSTIQPKQIMEKILKELGSYE